MSTSYVSLITIISHQVIIYLGLFLFIAGLLGGLLNIIVFLSLKTFRQSSCAFYLTAMSIVNIFNLFTGLLTYIMIYGFAINWTNMSLSFCKFRPFNVQFCVSMSFTCMCLAIIDQFLATCAHPRWHQFNNIKLARYILTGAVIVFILHGIPFLLYYNLILSPTTGQFTCTITNGVFREYITVIFFSFIVNTLSVTIMMLFGILAYRNVRQISYRTVPLVRRELDKQLTLMVLVQAFYDILVVTPTIILNICYLIIGTPDDPVVQMQLSSIQNLITILFYFHFVGPFYIYVCVSKRFRQQLIYVLFTIHLNRCRGPRMINNQVEPEI